MASRFIRYFLVRNLQGKELTDEKIRDFRRLTFAQGGVIVSIVLLQIFSFLGFPLHIELAETFFFMVLGLYVFLLWDMLRNYTSNRAIIVLNFIFIIGVFLIGVIFVNPFGEVPQTPGYRVILAAIQVCLLGVECTVIYFTLQEFFRKDLGIPIRLWGAACIYLMIGLAFGSVYETACILQIDCMGVDIPLQTSAMMKRIEFSMMILSGMDTPYENASQLVHSIGMVEALWGQLFVVLIVARLLMK